MHSFCEGQSNQMRSSAADLFARAGEMAWNSVNLAKDASRKTSIAVEERRQTIGPER
jgi:hypothetical protein